MDIDDELDFFGEDSTNKMTEPEIGDWVFPVFSREFGECNLASFGTGFFINNEGHFITAGHVLSENNKAYNAFINGKEYDFEILHIENEKKEPPICEDLAICIIRNMESIAKYDYAFVENRINGENLSFSGYSLRKYIGCSKRTICINENEPLHLLTPNANDAKIEVPTRNVQIVGGQIIVDLRPICENVRSLVFNRDFKGLSGGPVYKGKSIYGMLIGKEYILSDYIVKKLKQLNIQFFTNQ